MLRPAAPRRRTFRLALDQSRLSPGWPTGGQFDIEDLTDPRLCFAAGPPVDARLYEALVLWLTTVREDLPPHLVPRCFHWDRATVLILTNPHGKEVRSIRHEPRVTLARHETNGRSTSW
jgi:hypothetical protein